MIDITYIVLKKQDITSGQNAPVSSPSTTHSLGENQSKKHILVLDGLRAVACLGVLVFHLNLLAGQDGMWGPFYGIHTLTGLLTFFAVSTFYAGQSCVILFFVLSGFLLFLPYARALLFDSAWPSLRRFYIRRIFRILPGYYVALFLMVLFFHPAFLHASHWHDLWLFLTFSMDKKLSENLNGPFWTLAIEFQFYLLLPIIAWLFSLLVCQGTVQWRMLKLTCCLLLMTAWGLLTRYWGLAIVTTPKLDFLLPHALSLALKPYLYSDQGKYLEVFAVGMLICMLYTYTHYAPWAHAWRIRMHRLSPLLLFVGLILIAWLSFWYFYFVDMNMHNYPSHPKSYVVLTFLDPSLPTMIASRYWAEWQALAYALGYGCCLLALLYGSARLKRPFEWSSLRWIGSISFSLYMWHVPFMYLFFVLNANIRRQGWGSVMQYGVFWCWILVVVLPISAMLYRWIEQPGMRLGERLIRKLER